MLEKNVALSIRGAMAAWKARLELHGWDQVDNGWTGATLFWRRQGASGMFFRKVSDGPVCMCGTTCRQWTFMLKGREENFSLVFCFPGNGDSGPLKQARCGNSHQHDMTEDETFEKVDFHEMELEMNTMIAYSSRVIFQSWSSGIPILRSASSGRAISRWPASRKPSGMLPLPTAK